MIDLFDLALFLNLIPHFLFCFEISINEIYKIKENFRLNASSVPVHGMPLIHLLFKMFLK
jgi:hypothetical protein